MEGQPQNQNPSDWGNLIAFLSRGTSGTPGYPPDNALNDPTQGVPLSGGADVCNELADAQTDTSQYLDTLFYGNPVPYQVLNHNSNFFASLLLGYLGLNFGIPPDAPGWGAQ